MRPREGAGQKGVAMVTAIVLALIVSVIAAGVLSLTMRRFEQSAFRTAHAVGMASSESGLQYAFARLDKDTTYNDPNFPGVPLGLKDVVKRKRESRGVAAIPATGPENDAAEYIIRCHDDPTLTEDQILDPDGAGPLQPTALHMDSKVDTVVGSPTFGQYVGGKHVTVRIRFFTAADIAALPASPLKDLLATRPYTVRAYSNYGTGEQ